jgi:hypothetical protein
MRSFPAKMCQTHGTFPHSHNAFPRILVHLHVSLHYIAFHSNLARVTTQQVSKHEEQRLGLKHKDNHKKEQVCLESIQVMNTQEV